jgi:hypothetical protein
MISKCRNCVYWKPIPPWQGQCTLHPWLKPRWSEDAEPNGCTSYTDKYETIYAHHAAK